MKRDLSKLSWIAGCAIFLAFCVDVLFYRKAPGVSFPIFSILLLGTTYMLARRFQVTIDLEAKILMLLVLVLSSMVFFRSSTLIVALDIIASLCLYLFLLGRFVGLSLREFLFLNYLRQFFGAPVQSLMESFWAIKGMFDSRDELVKNVALRQISRGVMLAMPILAVLTLLLSSADLVFNKYVNDLVDILKRFNFLEHISILSAAFIILLGLLTYAFYRLSGQKQGEETELSIARKLLGFGFLKSSLLLIGVGYIFSIFFYFLTFLFVLFYYASEPSFIGIMLPFLPLILLTLIFVYTFYSYKLQENGDQAGFIVVGRSRTISFIESTIILGSINVLLTAFILLQFTYLFGGTHNITEQGFTYAEYAHKGFFELIAVSLFSFMIILLTDSRSRQTNLSHTRWLKLLNIILIGLVSVIMISAFKRVLIYETVYGCTILRVYTQIFIVLLGVISLLLLYKLVTNRSEVWFCLRSFAAIILFLIGLNIANIDGIIANLNIQQFKTSQDKELLVYNMDLSNDAIDQIIESYYLLDPKELDGEINRRLKSRLKSITELPWQSYSLPNARSFEKLNRWEVDHGEISKQI